MRRPIVVFAAFLLCAGFLSSARAEEGEQIFTAKCGSCHRSGGEAAVFGPTKYAIVQWERFFKKNKHAKLKDISAQFSETDLQAVRNYLAAHAADSDKPQAVGLR
ncbi:MAG: c-type cytochrome [Deltaproteobacteria bacterium]|nr:c-type cytochrome [Deltaproteobacteria bacterium]